MQKTIRIGGVPEHFNLPWHLALNDLSFEKAGVPVEWKTYKGGTGEMNLALRNGDCDLCVVLTEGIITDIINGNPSKIISGYVKTPLLWGIHTGFDSPIQENEIFSNQRIAISRLGSGSHLMPIVHALSKGQTLRADKFIKVMDIDGAITSLNNGESEIFYWEKYTTKPFVENGKLKRIGEFISPWPCFVIAATDDIIEAAPESIDKVLKIIHSTCNGFMNDENAVDMVSKKYGIEKADARHWFHATEWATDSWVSDKMLVSVLYTLKAAGVVKASAAVENLVWKRN